MKELNEIVVIDYGCGNLESVVNIIEHVGGYAEISNDPSVIGKYQKIVLPGVGHFKYGMECLKNSGLIPVLEERRSSGAKIMGICLGMQLMTAFSEEGNCSGLGWFPVKTIKFPNEVNGKKLIVPHMGWNNISVIKQVTSIIPEDSRFYFVHSYYVDAVHEECCLTASSYGGVDFASSIHQDNLFGFQFHPEKSHISGMRLFKEFLKI
ncbi:imidazole glycerol phosphate synthase subunit HisH [Vibrio cholerae]|uniref:imidazole glycerol phosphate synthase subunit HisH n=1 Tax=Vibrio cholerae TaxID=666 RepID=UPI001E2C82E3|nr:imidazole glycerol phosphate synthase subunit HisH [Vibrio cholerae]